LMNTSDKKISVLEYYDYNLVTYRSTCFVVLICLDCRVVFHHQSHNMMSSHGHYV